MDENVADVNPTGPKKSHQKSLRKPLKEVKNPPYEIVGYDSVRVNPEKLRETAAAKMSQAMENGILEEQTFGNKDGLDMLNRFRGFEETLKDIQEELKESKEETAQLREDLQVLQASSDSYLEVRNRFLDVYCRDILGDKTKNSEIRNANKTFHSADVITDTYLYIQGRRRDTDVFERLYSLLPEKVSFLGQNRNSHLIRIINEMATLRAEGEQVSEEVEKAFQKLVDRIKKLERLLYLITPKTNRRFLRQRKCTIIE